MPVHLSTVLDSVSWTGQGYRDEANESKRNKTGSPRNVKQTYSRVAVPAW